MFRLNFFTAVADLLPDVAADPNTGKIPELFLSAGPESDDVSPSVIHAALTLLGAYEAVQSNDSQDGKVYFGTATKPHLIHCSVDEAAILLRSFNEQREMFAHLKQMCAAGLLTRQDHSFPLFVPGADVVAAYSEKFADKLRAFKTTDKERWGDAGTTPVIDMVLAGYDQVIGQFEAAIRAGMKSVQVNSLTARDKAEPTG